MMYTPKIKHWLFLFGLPVLLAVSASAPLPQGTAWATELCQMENTTFTAGEEIVYKVYYNWNFMWLSAGEVTFRVYDDEDAYHLSARGRTYRSYEWFFTVRDNYDSYIDKETLLPSLSIRDIREGDYERYDKVTFDQQKYQATSLKGHSRADATPESFDLDGCMHDILSIVYYMRNLNFDEMNHGDIIPVRIFFDRETYPLKVHYLGRESNTRVRGSGRFKTHKFSPQLIAGEVFKEGDEMTVYVTQDQNKIPVLIESPVSVGSVKVVLKSHKGLQFPVTAKVR
jgi:hypothetical protein